MLYKLLHDPVIRAPIAISLGAIAGALSRYYLTLWFTQRFGMDFPYGTFCINLSGATIMGFFSTLALERLAIPSEVGLLVAVGFLGSYTTFSTYALDTMRLVRAGQIQIGLMYWLGSGILGVIGLEVGTWLARRWPMS